MNRQSFEHEVIGILESGEIVTLGCVFEHSDGSRGAVGTMFDIHFLTNYDNDFDAYRDWLSEAGMNDEDLSGYVVQDYMNEHEFPGQDNSYSSYWSKIKAVVGLSDEYTLSCSGGGRCFSHDMKWKKIINQDLLDLALSYEKQD